MNKSGTTLDEIDKTASGIAKEVKAPVLVVYYDDYDGRVADGDVALLYNAFRDRGWRRDKPHDKLYVVLHTYGGNPDAAYRLSQVIRDFAKKVEFIVPYHATSAGTLMCLCGNKIHLGAYATLSPIDITVDDVELASIEHFTKFAIDARLQLERKFEENDIDGETNCETKMLVKMVEQVSALDIGSLYRQSTLTAYYAHRLMVDYMFAELTNKETLAQKIANSLLHDFPAHDFALDYHVCLLLGLPAVELDEDFSESGKSLVNSLDDLVEQGVVCKDLGEIDGENYKAPFFRLYVP